MRGGAVAAVVSLLALAGCECGGCANPDAPRLPVLDPSAPIPELGTARPGYEIDGRLFAADQNGEGEVAAVIVDAGGKVVYAARRGHGWIAEDVARQALSDAPALAHSPASGEAVIVVAVAPPQSDVTVAIDAAGTAQEERVPDEGTLLLARRRSPRLWRKRLIARRALRPSVAVGQDEAVHLVFLQPAGKGDYLVVYARIDEVMTVREVVGHTPYPTAAVLRLVGGRAVVAYLAAGPKLVIASANERHVFTGVDVPGAVFGSPNELPLDFDFQVPPGGVPTLAWLRAVPASSLGVTAGSVPVPAEGTFLAVGRTVLGPGDPITEVVGLVRGEPGLDSVALSRDGMTLVAATARAGFLAEYEEGRGWEVRMPAASDGLRAGVAGNAAVWMNPVRLWTWP